MNLTDLSEWDLLRALYRAPDLATQHAVHAELNRRAGGSPPTPIDRSNYHGEDVGPWSWLCVWHGSPRHRDECPHCNPY